MILRSSWRVIGLSRCLYQLWRILKHIQKEKLFLLIIALPGELELINAGLPARDIYERLIFRITTYLQETGHSVGNAVKAEVKKHSESAQTGRVGLIYLSIEPRRLAHAKMEPLGCM